MNEVLLAFMRHSDRHYRRIDGTATNELAQYRQTFRLVKELFGATAAADFGPRSLKILRQRMDEREPLQQHIDTLLQRAREMEHAITSIAVTL